jgi:hypothetical protein
LLSAQDLTDVGHERQTINCHLRTRPVARTILHEIASARLNYQSPL